MRRESADFIGARSRAGAAKRPNVELQPIPIVKTSIEHLYVFLIIRLCILRMQQGWSASLRCVSRLSLGKVDSQKHDFASSTHALELCAGEIHGMSAWTVVNYGRAVFCTHLGACSWHQGPGQKRLLLANTSSSVSESITVDRRM